MEIGSNTVSPLAYNRTVSKIQSSNTPAETNEVASKESSESRQLQNNEGESVSKSGRFDAYA